MVRFDDAGLAASAGEDATRAHRADHWVLFEEDDRASLLKASLPELEWHRVGGCDALAFDDFLALALEGWAHLVPGTPTAPTHLTLATTSSSGSSSATSTAS